MTHDTGLHPIQKGFNQKAKDIETKIVDDVFDNCKYTTSVQTRVDVLSEFMSDGEDRSWGYIVDCLESVCADGTNAFYDYFQTLLDMVEDGIVEEWGGTFDRTYQLIVNKN